MSAATAAAAAVTWLIYRSPHPTRVWCVAAFVLCVLSGTAGGDAGRGPNM
jgi:hypothetical protein